MVHLTHISKHYGSQFLYRNASFQVQPQDKIGLVGSNGSGKSTLFRLITQEEHPDEGDVNISDKWIIGYFSQNVAELSGRSALEEVKAGAGRVSELAQRIQDMEAALERSVKHPLSEAKMTTLLEQYGDAQLEFEQRGGYQLEARAKEILTGLGIGPEDHHRPIETFSGGWKMRIALAQILALQPDLLLMDEPTNHLDLESIVWLEQWLMAFPGALVMTSHDRDFMNRIVSKIVEISNQTITSYSGNYDFYLRERKIRQEQLLAAHQKQQDMLAKEEEFIARFAARASHAAQVQSRVKKLEKVERIEIPPDEKTIQFVFPEAPRSGNDVVKIQELAKSWSLPDGPPRSVLSGVSGMVRRLDKVAVVGVNGAGKSTLLKLIAGVTEPSEGTVTVGASVQLGYFSQNSLDVLDPEQTIYEEVHNRIPQSSIGFVRNLLGAFLFSGDDVYKKIGSLSGGEKSRVVLATLLARPLNLLILDEPTNHLDIRSREMLLEALQKFEGTVLLVSHDRHFLRSIVNRVFEVDHGEMRIFEGSYEFYLAQKTHH